MAEDSDLEKTESASPQRLEKAREDGDVPRSRELAMFTMLLAAGGGIWFSGEKLIRQLKACWFPALASSVPLHLILPHFLPVWAAVWATC